MNDLFGGLAPQRPSFPRREDIVRKAEMGRAGQFKVRWSLTRAWGSGPAIAWFGLNPSNADGERDDPTMWREIGFSFRWGYGSLVKFNIEPFVSSKPAEMRRMIADTRSAFTGRHENAEYIRAFLRAAPDTTLVAAWGAGVDYQRAAEFISSLFWDWHDWPKWFCLGLTSGGSPIHTLARGKHRVPDDAKLKPFTPPEKGEYA